MKWIHTFVQSEEFTINEDLRISVYIQFCLKKQSCDQLSQHVTESSSVFHGILFQKQYTYDIFEGKRLITTSHNVAQRQMINAKLWKIGRSRKYMVE